MVQPVQPVQLQKNKPTNRSRSSRELVRILERLERFGYQGFRKDKRQTMALEKIGKIFKDIYYDQFKWSVVKNTTFFIVGVKIAIECNGITLMPPVSV